MSANCTQPAVDMSRMREAADGDEEFLKQLVEVFLDDTALRLRELNDALRAGDSRILGRTAHQLKGSSANVGAMQLFDLAKTLEKLGAGDQLGEAGKIMAGIEAEYVRVRSILEPMLH